MKILQIVLSASWGMLEKVTRQLNEIKFQTLDVLLGIFLCSIVSMMERHRVCHREREVSRFRG